MRILFYIRKAKMDQNDANQKFESLPKKVVQRNKINLFLNEYNIIMKNNQNKRIFRNTGNLKEKF